MKLIKTALLIGTAAGAVSAAKAFGAFEMLPKVNVDTMLDYAGLMRRPSGMSRVLGGVGMLGLGAAIGAGAAVMLSPSLRSSVIKKLEKVGEDAGLTGREKAPESSRSS